MKHSDFPNRVYSSFKGEISKVRLNKTKLNNICHRWYRVLGFLPFVCFYMAYVKNCFL